ncbi:MAG TPA: PH domain-containing protein [Candidatus Saccharimonadales bacterium]|nr:PH domain-containing protein [Candidatus Saccharimonadales bacterium]
MVHISVIEARLSQLGVKLSRWYQAEKNELVHILLDHEKIVACVPGRYFAGYALLVATDQRLLLIDKRTFFITLEDIRYDMISETDFSARLFDATLHIFTLNKQHRFTSMKYKRQLRDLTNYVQRRVMELRQGTDQLAQPDPAQPFEQARMAPSHFIHLPHPHTPKLVGAAAISGANRFHGFRPSVPHVSSNYTGPTMLSSLFGPDS